MRDYTKDKLDISEFNRYTSRELDEVFELNDNLKIESNKDEESGLKYVTARNFFKRPDAVIYFLKHIPSEDKTESILRDKFTYMASNAPGFQQPLESKLARKLCDEIYELGKKTGLHKYERQQVQFNYYTNTCYPGMKACQNNWLPHIDPFSIACNMYLTQNDNTGTSFLRFVTSDGKRFYNSMQLSKSKLACDEYRKKFEWNVESKKYWSKNLIEGTDISDWVYYEGDSPDEPLPRFERYKFIKVERNMCSMYRGNRWHSISYDADKEKNIRYSLVGVIK